MEPKVNPIIVITFLSALLTAMLLTIIWLSIGFAYEKYTTYAVYMTEAVTGLSLSSPVEYNGVNVGEVSNILLDNDHPQFVELILKIKAKTPVTRSTVATLASRGITSITFISLRDVGNDNRPIMQLADQPYPIIKSGPSGQFEFIRK